MIPPSLFEPTIEKLGVCVIIRIALNSTNSKMFLPDYSSFHMENKSWEGGGWDARLEAERSVRLVSQPKRDAVRLD